VGRVVLYVIIQTLEGVSKAGNILIKIPINIRNYRGYSRVQPQPEVKMNIIINIGIRQKMLSR